MFSSVYCHCSSVPEFVNYICEKYSKRWKSRKPVFIIQDVHGLADLYRGYAERIPEDLLQLQLLHNYIVRKDNSFEYYVLLVSEYEYMKYGMI